MTPIKEDEQETAQPQVSKELLAYLDLFYPELCACPLDTMEEVRGKAGSRKVVNHLHDIYKRQNEIVF